MAESAWRVASVFRDFTGEREAASFLCHDLISDDPEGSQRFYEALFDWHFESLPTLRCQYGMICRDGEQIGG